MLTTLKNQILHYIDGEWLVKYELGDGRLETCALFTVTPEVDT
jgi:hypothetical protein